MLSLGVSVARFPETFSSTLTAISVPARGFSSVLVATGFLLARGEDTDRLDLEHLAFLRDLKDGSSVWYHTREWIYHAVYKGIVSEQGTEYLKVEVGKGKRATVNRLPLNLASRIQVASDDREYRQSAARRRASASEFAIEAFARQSGNRFAIQSHVDAVLIGRKNFLGAELVDQLFGIVTESGVKEGYLQEIVRGLDMGLIPQSQGFSALVHSPYEQPPELRGNPLAAIFDGPAAFLRSRATKFSVPHWIIIIDRTARQFEDTCQIVDEIYLNRKAIVPTKYLPRPLSGIEIMSVVRGR